VPGWAALSRTNALAVLAAKVHILGQDLDRLQPPQRQTRPGDLKAP
jgi:hypothetical protein